MEREVERNTPEVYHHGELRANGYVRGLGVTYLEYMEQTRLTALELELIECLKSMEKAANCSTPLQSVRPPCGPTTSGQTPSTSGKS